VTIQPTTTKEATMTEPKDTQLEAREKRPLSTTAEQTWSGPVFNPAVDILENDSAITVLADMPGVCAEDLKVDLFENVLTLTGPVQAPETEAETEVHREYRSGTFFRQFSLAETIDQSRIEAKLEAGVLRLRLPKVEAAKPRRITVQSGS